MNLIKHFSVMSGAFFALAVAANAQSFTGSIGIQEDSSQSGSYTASSLTMDLQNYTEPSSGTGTFAPANVPMGTEAYATNVTLSGLSSTAVTFNLNDFVVIGGPGHFGSTGTSPNNRFQFELQTLTENNSTLGDFTGTGILTDTAGTYSATPAELLLSFSGANNYSFTLQAVPEPATLSLVAVGLLGTLAIRRRKN